jgi:hypothetical protein
MAVDPPEVDPSQILWREIERSFEGVERLLERVAEHLAREGANEADAHT